MLSDNPHLDLCLHQQFASILLQHHFHVQEILVHATYVPCSTDNTGARSGSPQLSMIVLNSRDW